MILSALIKHTPIKEQIGSISVDITGITIDSRNIKPGFLFVAISGNLVDGHSYIQQAIENGAIAILHEKALDHYSENISYISSNNTRTGLAQVSNIWFDNPSKKMDVYGITGTNGKTTISYFLAHLLRSAGVPSAIIGTTGVWTLNKQIPLKNTTPDILVINKILNDLYHEGIRAVCMEVSSHGLEQKRVEGIHFKGGIFTNLTHDHLDYHGTFKKYLQAKQILFNQLNNNSFAIANIEDASWAEMMSKTQAKIIKVGVSSEADYQLLNVNSDDSLNTIELLHHSKKIFLKTNTMGQYNYSNLLQAFALVNESYGCKESILKATETLPIVPGRLEKINTKYRYPIFVDYAHTPDAMENVLATLRATYPEKKLITVFGCGGDRDKEKRPIMGSIANKYSDKIIITDDNPRFENAQSIIDEIATGIPDLTKYNTITPRINAIKVGLEASNHDTILAILGKGHEDYQDIQGKRIPYNDIDIIEDFFQ